MPHYKVKSPQGDILTVWAPEGADKKNILSYAATQHQKNPKGLNLALPKDLPKGEEENSPGTADLLSKIAEQKLESAKQKAGSGAFDKVEKPEADEKEDVKAIPDPMDFALYYQNRDWRTDTPITTSPTAPPLEEKDSVGMQFPLGAQGQVTLNSTNQWNQIDLQRHLANLWGGKLSAQAGLDTAGTGYAGLVFNKEIK